jgi:hypothetical protein
MKVQVPIATLALAAATIAAAAPAVAAERGEPRVEQMVVFKDGSSLHATLSTARTTVALGRRTCAIAAATPLAALLRTPLGGATLRDAVELRDYGSCSRRPADSAGLFVRAIRRDRNAGLNGWVYKVGRKLATAGAADPAGPFGSGRLRKRQRVVWFYCVFDAGSCQRSLGLRARLEDGAVRVEVTGYDDAGDGRPVAGARIVARRERSGRPASSATTGADGAATLQLGAGSHTLVATRGGTIRSFPERVEIE